ncbi:MAG: thiamine-phosphate kinase [Planctomycetota bacterium]|nr:thiamine-phosphate kinase [Planctomycetota bacterium]
MKEFELIDHLRSFNPTLGEGVLLPPGDDLGAVRMPGDQVLAGVDQVIGGVHLPVDAAPARFARKVLRRSLSDVAAMAAIPTGGLVTAAVPRGLPESWTIEFADALNAEASRQECPIFGGDVAAFGRHDGPPVVTATVLATPDPVMGGRFLRRSGARPGDRIMVSGCFGNSLRADGRGHHESFEPRVELALTLHRHLGDSLHCLIDVSDGLLADSGHLARESGVRFELRLESVPQREGPGGVTSLSDGEDYELCFTVGEDADLPPELLQVKLSEIGGVSSGEGVVITEHGKVVESPRSGWEHQA